MKISLFLLVSYGITNIIVFGSIFNGFREYLKKINPNYLGKLITCPLCLSMWIGMCLSIIFIVFRYDTPMSIYGIKIIPIIIFLDGCLTSGGVWLIHTIQEHFETKN